MLEDRGKTKTGRQSFIQENHKFPKVPDTHTHTHMGPPFPVASLQYRHMAQSCALSDPDIRQQCTLGNTVNTLPMRLDAAEVIGAFLQNSKFSGHRSFSAQVYHQKAGAVLL